MIKRCTQHNPKRDAVLLNEGAEGEGKTTLSVAEGYYVADKTGRTFNHTRVFSDVTKMIKFLQDTDEEIAIWDEPALQALSGDALTTIVKNLKRMLMMCRNKRHFIMINMTYFTEFGNYIVWQRPLGMVHVYSRNNLEPGRFIYIKKKYLEKLWYDWRSKRVRNYKKYGARHIRGTFPDVLNQDYKYNVLSDFNFKEYEKNKNEAIASIGKETKKLNEKEIRNNIIIQTMFNYKTLHNKVSTKELASLFGLSQRTIEQILKKYKENEAEKSLLINKVGIEN
jgi:hypothetical protein